MLKIKSSKTKVDIKDFLRKRLLTESLSVSSWSPALLPKKIKRNTLVKLSNQKKSMYFVVKFYFLLKINFKVNFETNYLPFLMIKIEALYRF